MKAFVTTEEFRSLNIGFSLDEGIFRIKIVLAKKEQTNEQNVL